MNFTDFITHNGKRVIRDQFIHLIQVVQTDGKTSHKELEMLHKAGKNFGLTDPEIDQFIKSEENHHYHPPYSLNDKFDHLYNIVQIVMADDSITTEEIKIMNRFAIEAGFEDKIIEVLLKLLIEGIEKGVDEEKLLQEFKKKFM